MASQDATQCTSHTFGSRVRSQNNGKTWEARYYVDGKGYNAGTYASEYLAAHALARCAMGKSLHDNTAGMHVQTRCGIVRRAYHFHHLNDAGPGSLPKLSEAEKAQVSALSVEELRASFKAASFVFSRGSSAYRGVSWDKNKLKWQAAAWLPGGNGKVSLGYYKSEEAAARAYDKAVLAKGR